MIGDSDKLLQHVFSFVPERELYHCLFVQKKWMNLIKDPSFMVGRFLPYQILEVYDRIAERPEGCPDYLKKDVFEIARKIQHAFFGTEKSYDKYEGVISDKLQEVLFREYPLSPGRMDERFSSVKGMQLEYHKRSIQIKFQDLPPSMERLHLVGNIEVQDSLADLPKGLRSFGISHFKRNSRFDLSKLPESLKHLDIMPGDLVDADFAAIKCSLNSLRLRMSTRLTGLFLEKLSALSKLDLFKCSAIEDDGIYYLPPHLTVLRVSDCPSLTERSLKYIGKLTQLKHLELTNINIDGSGLKSLPKSLSSLKLSLDSLGSEGLKGLKNHKSLRKLHLDYWTAKQVKAIQTLSSLTCLELYRSAMFGGIGVVRHSLPGLSSLTNLQTLRVKNGIGLNKLPQSLKLLSLSSCFILDGDLSHIRSLEKLEKLYFFDCDGLRLSRQTVRKKFPNSLRRVTVSGCPNVKRLNLSFVTDQLLSISVDQGLVLREKVAQLLKKYPYLKIVEYTAHD